MMRLWPSSIRFKLLLSGFLVFLSVVLLVVFYAWYQRKLVVEEARGRMEKVLSFAVFHEEEAVRETYRILAMLAEFPIVREGGEPASRFLGQVLKNSPDYTNFVVCRADGKVIASAIPLKSEMDFSDREYFQDLLKAKSFTIGTYVVGRITGKPIVPFGYPVLDGRGDVRAVIVAPLDLSRVTRFEAEVDIQTPANSPYIRLDRNGDVLSAYPEAQVFGRGHPMEKALFRKISEEKKGTFLAVGTDRIERLYLFSSFRGPMTGEGGYAVLGIPTKSLFAEVNRRNRFYLSGIVVIGALFFVLVWFGGNSLFAGPLSLLTAAARRMAAGDLTARAGLTAGEGEIGELGRAFDGLAEELERRQDDSRKLQEELRRSAASAEEEKTKTEAIIAALGDGITIHDRQFRIVFQNQLQKDLTGDHLGEYCYKAYENSTDVCDGCPLLMSFSDGAIHTVERKIQTGRGLVYLEITASPLRDASGNVTAGIEVVRDITSRRQAEETQARLAMAVEQAGEAVVITDRGAAIQYVNPAFERFTGYSREEVIGKNPSVLRSGKLDETFYREMWDVLTQGNTWTGHFINQRKDGSLYEEDATISPVRDSAGVIVSYVAVKRDVTHVLSLERQVRTAQRMEAVGTLAGGIAHDFNNVLTVIIGFGEMLRRRLAGDPKATSDLQQILESAERASALTRQLLTFARRQVIDPVNLDLNEVVADLERLLGKIAKEDIRMRTFPAQAPVIIRADRGQVEQVVMNLCLNARDAMPAGGQLLIETGVVTVEDGGYLERHPYAKPGRYGVLSVSDTGIGMDEKTRERVFEPFFTTKGPDKGTGLGLAVVYGIVKQHGGFVHVYSEPGSGTTFRVYFPEADLPADRKIVESLGTVPRGNETVLLAEDNPSVRQITAQILASHGYRVLAAGDGEEALDLFREHGPEIAMVALDVAMPKKGGRQAYDEMTAMRPGLKALFLSGHAFSAIHEAFVLLPGLSFLQKPFAPEALARKVREVLDGG